MHSNPFAQAFPGAHETAMAFAGQQIEAAQSRAYSATLERTGLSDEAINAMAVARVQSDMDALTDWMYGACMFTKHVSSERITRVPELMGERIKAADNTQLIHLLMTDDDAAVVMAARAELMSLPARQRRLRGARGG